MLICDEKALLFITPLSFQIIKTVLTSVRCALCAIFYPIIHSRDDNGKSNGVVSTTLPLH